MTDERMGGILAAMDEAVQRMRKDGVTVEPFWTSKPDEDPEAWDVMAVRYLDRNGPVSKDLTDGSVKAGLDRLERRGLVEPELRDGGQFWRLTVEGRYLATVADVMES